MDRIKMLILMAALEASVPVSTLTAAIGGPEGGIAGRDITPASPIRLARYAPRNHESDKVASPLLAQAIALKNESGERFVLVSLDNCEVSHAFMQPVLQALSDTVHLGRGEVAVVSSHTHSAPVLNGVLTDMGQPASA